MQLKNRMLVMTNYTKIVTKTYNSILLEFNCVTKFDTRCPDWHKVTVTFVARSDDVKLIYALCTWSIKFASHAQLTFEPLYDKAIIAKKRSHLIVMFSYEKKHLQKSSLKRIFPYCGNQIALRRSLSRVVSTEIKWVWSLSRALMTFYGMLHNLAKSFPEEKRF